MTVVYYAIPGVLAAIGTGVMLHSQGVSQLVGIVAALVVSVVVMMAWSYSPLPDHNGGMLAGTENTGWGWGPDEDGSKE